MLSLTPCDRVTWGITTRACAYMVIQSRDSGQCRPISVCSFSYILISQLLNEKHHGYSFEMVLGKRFGLCFLFRWYSHSP